MDDDYYQEWSFDPDDNLDSATDAARDAPDPQSKILFLHNLHHGSPHARQQAAPPVLRDYRG